MAYKLDHIIHHLEAIEGPMRPQLYSSGFLLFRRIPGLADNQVGVDQVGVDQVGVDQVGVDRPQNPHCLEFLLMQHAERWDLPKGHLDLGESKKQAALRELMEETGVEEDLIEIEPIFSYTSQYWVIFDGEQRLKELTIFLALLTREFEIQPTEHLGFRWFPFSPPHAIQAQTIDPLLASVTSHLENHPWLVSNRNSMSE